MKRIRSPLKKNVNSTLPYKRISHQENSNLHLNSNLPYHERQHRNNSNSIKKVLKELTNMKKQLKDLKNTKANLFSNQTLDMSQCRKIKNITRKSSQSPTYNRIVLNSSSQSKSKSNSQHKEISTQTKRLKQANINQFSFSIDSKSGKHHNNNKILKKQRQSLSQQSQEHHQSTAYKKKSQPPTKRGQTNEYSKEYTRRHGLDNRIAVLEASQLYEKHLSVLKNSFDVLQISSNIFSVDQKLKLNIQLQRFSKNIGRIPIYMQKPEQYYDSIGMYARNINNQLNNMIILMNRCDKKPEKVKEREMLKTIQQLKEQKSNARDHCEKCEQNEKKGFERMHRRQLKKLKKEVQKFQLQLQQKIQELNVLSTQNTTLKRQLQSHKSKIQQHTKEISHLQQKQTKKTLQQSQLQQKMKELQTQANRQLQKKILLQQDVRYYKLQIQRIKSFHNDRIILSENKKEMKELKEYQIKGLQKQNRQLKQKQGLYQQILKEKQLVIFTLGKEKDKMTMDDLYQLRTKLQQKDSIIKEIELNIQHIQGSLTEQKEKNAQINNTLQLCLDQINKLHIEIDNLQSANEKYKDKFVKTKIINEKISKRQEDGHNKKGQTLLQINALIKHHRQNIVKNK